MRRLPFESLSLTDVPAEFVPCVSSRQPTLHQGPSLYTKISTVSHTTTDSSNRIQASQESSNWSSGPSVCSHPTHHHIFPILHPVRLASSLRVLLVISCQFDSCVGVFGSIFVSAPPHSARAGGLRQAGLRARPSNASLQPEAGSPYNVSTYSGVSDYASSPARSPMLPYSPYSPASAPPPPSGRRTPSGGTSVFQVHRRDWGSPVACTRRAVLPPAVGCGHRRQRLRGIAGTGTWYILLWKFPTYAPIAVEQRCSSACVEGYGEEG